MQGIPQEKKERVNCPSVRKYRLFLGNPLFEEFIQKEPQYTICAASMSSAIEIIKNDKSLKVQTAELREQIRIEQEEYDGNRQSNAEEWRNRILSGRVGGGTQVEEAKKQYRKIADLLFIQLLRFSRRSRFHPNAPI